MKFHIFLEKPTNVSFKNNYCFNFEHCKSPFLPSWSTCRISPNVILLHCLSVMSPIVHGPLKDAAGFFVFLQITRSNDKDEPELAPATGCLEGSTAVFQPSGRQPAWAIRTPDDHLFINQSSSHRATDAPELYELTDLYHYHIGPVFSRQPRNRIHGGEIPSSGCGILHAFSYSRYIACPNRDLST